MQLLGNPFGEFVGLILIEEPIGANPFLEPQDFFIHAYLPWCTLLRLLGDLNKKIVPGSNRHVNLAEGSLCG